jgi:hypothetical protein
MSRSAFEYIPIQKKQRIERLGLDGRSYLLPSREIIDEAMMPV